MQKRAPDINRQVSVTLVIGNYATAAAASQRGDLALNYSLLK